MEGFERIIPSRANCLYGTGLLAMSIGRFSISVNQEVLRVLGEPERIDIMENKASKELAIIPCKDFGRKVRGHSAVAFSSNSIAEVVQRYFGDVPLSYTYHIPGVFNKKENAVIFSIENTIPYERRYYRKGSPFMQKWYELQEGQREWK